MTFSGRRPTPSKAFDQQKADAVKAFDEKLAKLGYQPDGAKPAKSAKPAKKSHHKRPAVQPSAIAKAKDHEPQRSAAPAW